MNNVTTYLVTYEAVVLATALWALVDLTGRRTADLRAIGESKGRWIALISVSSLLVGIVGVILSLVYLASIRPRIATLGVGVKTRPPTTSRTSLWAFFAAWVLVGSAAALVLAGAFAIGVIVVPFAVVATVLLARSPTARRATPGLIAGVAMPVLVVAYLNRGGPGLVCHVTTSSLGTGQSCRQEWNPWFLAGGGVILLVLGLALFVRCLLYRPE